MNRGLTSAFDILNGVVLGAPVLVVGMYFASKKGSAYIYHKVSLIQTIIAASGFFITMLVLPADPEYREQVTTLLTLFAAPSDCYHLISDSEVTDFAGVRSIRYIPTFHAPMLKCYSFSIETADGLIFYSADTATEKTLCDFIHDHPDVKEIYIDTNDSTAPDSVHLNVDKLFAALSPEYRAITYMMHIPSVKCAEKGLALGFKIVP